MNLFALDKDYNNQICTYQSAKSHDDYRVSKMIVESCQMLSTTAIHFGYKTRYKKAHYNHPTTIWTRQSSANFNTLLSLAHNLKVEYSKRYGKFTHGCDDVIQHMVQLSFDDDFKKCFDYHSPTPIPLCMPDEYKINNNNLIDSYRLFFANKPRLRYYRSQPPAWVSELRSPHLPPIELP